MSSRDVSLPKVSSEPEIERYTLIERICHWVNGISYVYCLLTGLALFTPVLYWIAAVLGGGAVVRFWHPIAGLVFVAAVYWMHGIWQKDMKTTEKDLKWKEQIKDYIENNDQKMPAQGKYNFGQKQFFWIMVYGAIGLLLSGLFLWFPEIVSRSWHWILPIMIFIHEVSALATIAGFMIHVYMGVFQEPEGFRGIISGRVPASWAQRYHRLWFDQVSNDPKTRK